MHFENLGRSSIICVQCASYYIPVKESRYEIQVVLVVFLYVYILELSKASSQSNITLSYSFLQYTVTRASVLMPNVLLTSVCICSCPMMTTLFVDMSTPYERANFNLYKEIIMP